MGYDTKFWGSLKFTRRLTESELQTVEAILDAGQTSTPEIDAVIEREREERRNPGRAEFINVGNEIMRRASYRASSRPRAGRIILIWTSPTTAAVSAIAQKKPTPWSKASTSSLRTGARGSRILA